MLPLEFMSNGFHDVGMVRTCSPGRGGGLFSSIDFNDFLQQKPCDTIARHREGRVAISTHRVKNGPQKAIQAQKVIIACRCMCMSSTEVMRGV